MVIKNTAIHLMLCKPEINNGLITQLMFFGGEGGYATDYGFLGLVGSNADLTWHYIRTNSDCSTE